MKPEPTQCSRPLRAARTAPRGFTLIEIMIALAILGTALFILLDSHYSALRSYDKAWDKTTLADMMATAIGQAKAQVITGELNGQGDFGKRHPDYTYSFSAQSDDANDPSFYTVLVTVNTPDGGANEMTLYLYDTTGGLGAGGASQVGDRSAAGLGHGSDSSRDGTNRSSNGSSRKKPGSTSSGSRRPSGLDGRSGAT